MPPCVRCTAPLFADVPLQCGIVGLPNVGKTCLFNALAAAGAAAENFPFCTIEPNVGVVPLTDERLDRLAGVASSAKVVPAAVRLVDIAGLVKGAADGEGLGNRFLGHVREVDGLVHVLRCFPDPQVTHVSGDINPVADAETVELELILADLAVVDKMIKRLQRLVGAGDRTAYRKSELLVRVARHLNGGAPLRSMALATEEQDSLADLFLLSAKPMLYCANISEAPSAVAGAAHQAVIDLAARHKVPMLTVSAKLEAELAGLDPDDQATLLAELGLAQRGLDRLARAAYELLNLITFFTVGPKEARAWEIRAGTTAAQAAGFIHTDMQRGFIRAEVISSADYLAHGGETACRELGKMRLEGREYAICDGDIAHFRFNA